MLFSPPTAPLRLALVLLAAVGRTVPTGPSSDGSLSGVMQKWKEYQLQCLKYLYEAPPIVAEGKFCNRTFDNYACWPDGLPGTYVNVSCPWYLPWANTVLHGQVYRFCTPEGTWLLKENSTLPWRNLSECEPSDGDAPEEQLLNLSIIYTIGYALSFSALVIATAILLGFRHLHCTRNYIHLNLFTSFILRAISVFIKDSVVKWMYSTATQEHQWEGLISFQESLSCRLVFVMMQYCVAANYYWLLVEGMYLYTLLVLSVFSEQRIFRLYLCIGWGKLLFPCTCLWLSAPADGLTGKIATTCGAAQSESGARQPVSVPSTESCWRPAGRRLLGALPMGLRAHGVGLAVLIRAALLHLVAFCLYVRTTRGHEKATVSCMRSGMEAETRSRHKLGRAVGLTNEGLLMGAVRLVAWAEQAEG